MSRKPEQPQPKSSKTKAKKQPAKPAAPKRPRGRPSSYTPEMAARVCNLIASGQSLRTACKPSDMPDPSTVLRWREQNPDFHRQYAQACTERAWGLVEDALDIADDSKDDFVPDGEGGQRFNSEAVQRSRLRVDTRKWFASKLAPREFADKLDLNHGVQPENPLAKLLEQMGNKSSIKPVGDPDDQQGGSK